MRQQELVQRPEGPTPMRQMNQITPKIKKGKKKMQMIASNHSL
jgi:hypothetical protein